MTKFMVFQLGKQKFAIDVAKVNDVALASKIYPVPLIRDEVLGLMNVRGAIILILNICNLLELPDILSREHQKIMIVEHEQELFGFFIDEACGINEVIEADLIMNIERIDQVWQEISLGLFVLIEGKRDELVVVLDIDRLICKLF